MLLKDVFMKAANQNLQIKLSLDEGLQNVWNFLTHEYEGLDKSGIVRLALSNLAKTTKKHNTVMSNKEMLQFISELEQRKTGMTENELAEWWNKNKKNLV